MEENIREIILKELPGLITRDSQIRNWVWNLVHEYTFSRAETESRFEQMLAEIQHMHEEQARRWEDNQRELRELREEQARRWEDNQRELRELREEQARRWEEQARRWEDNQREIHSLLEQIQKVDHRIDRTIGALGARWGIASETTFRNALRGILEKSFGVKVERVEYRDESGEVFGRPEMVELDIVVQNGETLACELKSSLSKSDVYTFERKVRSYEKRSQRTIKRMLLISPILTDVEREVAASLGIEVYTDAEAVTP